ncbi:alginate lyase family protein [Streptomyces sp. GbtcB7]|uniref:alginate lyase family protein n=1 Tax=Streptomyces sp. GbtcB7 TaxID=2824752 RepID=UPI001C30F8A6|nr:alginate lyase family protein [Streptomyces sp. GbtcB7]
MRHAKSGLLARRRPRLFVAGAAAIALLIACYAWVGQGTPGAGAATTATKAVDAAPGRFAHPGITFDKADLNRLKKNLTKEPWKSSYAGLLADSRSSLGYAMQGPFAEVGRNADVHRSAYENDMQAVYGLTLRGYLSGKTAYSAKATKIMTSWCRTQTKWSGAEASFTIGDYAIRAIAAADVLRATFSGWTATDTKVCQKNFNDVYWPQLGVGLGASGSGSHLLNAGQGALGLQGAMAIAVFNDDRVKFNETVDAYRTDPMGGLRDSLANGEIGDTGRDQGHAYGQWMHLAAVAETAWKQGVDLYSAQNSRLLTAAEYYSRFNLGENPAYVRFGSGYGLYKRISADDGGERITPPAEGLDLIYNAYVVRKGLRAPYTTRLRAKAMESYNSMVYRRSADTSKATAPAAAWTAPAASTSVTKLTGRDIGTVGAAGANAYADGTWTVKSSGKDQLSGYRYAYRKLAGDGTIVTRVANPGAAKGGSAGLMLRASLDAKDSTPYVIQRLLGDGSAQTYWSSRSKGNSWSYWANFEDVDTPYWLKLVRRADYVYAYTSPDGKNWSPSASVLLTTLPGTVYVGLVVTSGDTTITNTATFDHLTVGTGTSSKVSQPHGLTAKTASGKVALTWKAPARTVSYSVLRATRRDGSYAVIATDVPGTRYTDTSVKTGTRYYYAVQAAGYAERSGASAEVGATP